MQPQTFEKEEILKIKLTPYFYIEIIIFESREKLNEILVKNNATILGAFLPMIKNTCGKCELGEKDCKFADHDKRRFGVIFLHKSDEENLDIVIHEMMHVMMNYMDYIKDRITKKDKWGVLFKHQEAACEMMQDMVKQYLIDIKNIK